MASGSLSRIGRSVAGVGLNSHHFGKFEARRLVAPSDLSGGGWLSYHAVWHSIYYSLQFHPKYVEKYGAYHDGKDGDEMPIAGALAYLKEHPEEDKPELFIAGRSLKHSALERLARLAFFEFLRRDPWFVFETFVIVKGRLIWNTIVDATVTEWSRAGWKARLLFFLIIALIGGMAAQRLVELQRFSRVATVVTIGSRARRHQVFGRRRNSRNHRS
jgi:hypothetical protein